MKFLFIFLFSAIASTTFAQTIINDKNAELRSVTAFTGIKVSGGIDVYLSQSEDYALAVSASEEKYRDGIKTEVIDGILYISYDGSNFSFNGNRKLRAYVSFKDLGSVEASGACDLIINGIYKSNSTRIKISGACEMKGQVDFDNLILYLSGASTVKVSGRVLNLKINASGASDVKNYDLSVNNCLADISGASDVRLTVLQYLSVKASGASTFYYKGNPEKKEVNSSGASNVSQRN